MKRLLEKWLPKQSAQQSKDTEAMDQLSRQVHAVYSLLKDLYGAEQLVLKAGKLEALTLMESDDLKDQVTALSRLVLEDPTVQEDEEDRDLAAELDALQDHLADQLARRTVEDDLEKKIAAKMQERHEDYIKEIRSQLLKDEAGPDNSYTLKKLADLEALEQRTLARSALEAMRPQVLADVVGQDTAVRSLMTKLSSPFPQHILLYGPPGVGKTTVARLALQEAKRRHHTGFQEEAPFIEVDGSTMRWDPREVTNPLLGSVHDPIYQGAKRDLADGSVPEPKPGLVTDAHGGVLFIDEIGELDYVLQTKLLKVLEDKRVFFESSYYDPDDTNVPKYIQKLFQEGAPADFVLIGATTRDPADINPAFRSRCAEVFFDPLTPGDITGIVERAAQRLSVVLAEGVAQRIAEYTIEGRQAVRLLADAYSTALYRLGPDHSGPAHIEVADIQEVIEAARLAPYAPEKASDEREVGRIFGLGVSGYMGSVLEIEAAVFPAKEKGKGQVRFNDTAGSMAKDSVFNAASVFRRLTGEELSAYDAHVNIIGGGRIDGPSAGVAIFLAILSAVRSQPLPQWVAVTGEISLQGKVKPVGGIHAKLYGARQAGIRTMFIPKDNARELSQSPKGLDVIAVETVDEILDTLFPDGWS